MLLVSFLIFSPPESVCLAGSYCISMFLFILLLSLTLVFLKNYFSGERGRLNKTILVSAPFHSRFWERCFFFYIKFILLQMKEIEELKLNWMNLIQEGVVYLWWMGNPWRSSHAKWNISAWPAKKKKRNNNSTNARFLITLCLKPTFEASFCSLFSRSRPETLVESGSEGETELSRNNREIGVFKTELKRALRRTKRCAWKFSRTPTGKKKENIKHVPNHLGSSRSVCMHMSVSVYACVCVSPSKGLWRIAHFSVFCLPPRLSRKQNHLKSCCFCFVFPMQNKRDQFTVANGYCASTIGCLNRIE